MLPFEIWKIACGGECGCQKPCPCQQEAQNLMVEEEASIAGKTPMPGVSIMHATNALVRGKAQVDNARRRIGFEGPSEFERQYQGAGKLDAVDPTVAAVIVESGLEDGDSGDDKISVGRGTWPASKLKPSQTSMVLEKAIGMALGMLASGKVGGDLGALVSSDGHILDGHHRWAATILASGSQGSVGGYGAKLPGAKLIRVLNLLTKGLFKVRGGKPGKGSLSQFKPGRVRLLLRSYVEAGVPGRFPIAAEKVRATLEDNFGSVENGIDAISDNAKLISQSVPGWAPDRKQMPVVDPGNVPKAVGYMNKGEVDWAPPYKQAYAEKASYMEASPAQVEISRKLLSNVLAVLRAQYFSYQTSHWQVVGSSFYGNHLLFQRLYESVQEQVDQLAEKMVGYFGSEAVTLLPQMHQVYAYCGRWGKIDCNHKRGLQSESDLQGAVRSAYEGIQAIGAMTLGLDDWLMATANAHEENTYLLQQALAPIPKSGKKASDAPTAEGDFYDSPDKKNVLEFAQSGAISNSVEVTEKAYEEDQMSTPEPVAIADAEKAPPLPVEVAKEPGGAELSTLNRYVIESQDPKVDKAIKINEKDRMASWLLEVSND